MATQNQNCDEHFIGEARDAGLISLFVAQETREWLAALGVRSMEGFWVASTCYQSVSGTTNKQQHLNLAPLLFTHSKGDGKPQTR